MKSRQGRGNTLLKSHRLDDRKQAEQALRQSEERLRLLFPIISNYGWDYTERIKQLLALGTQEFELETALLSNVTDQQYRVAQAVSLVGAAGAGHCCKLEETLCAEVLRRNDVLALENISDSPWGEHSARALFGHSAYLGVPVQVGKRIYGTLCFTSHMPHPVSFTNDDFEFLRLLAQWIGAELSWQEAEEALRRSEERQRLALEAGRMGTWCWYPTLNRMEYDENCRKLFGLEGSHSQGDLESCFTALHQEDRAAVRKQLFAALEDRQAYEAEYRVVHPDRSIHWIVSIGRGLYRNDELLGFNGVAFEISERKQAEEQLRQSESHFRALFEAGGVGHVECDATTGRFLRVNQQLCELTGYSAEELLKRTFPDITYPEDNQKTWDNYQRFIWGATPVYAVEKRYVRQDGSLIWVSVTSTLLRDPTGRPWRTVAVVQDINERKRTEEYLRESEERFRFLADATPVLIWMAGVDKLCDYFNQSWLDFTGRTLEQELGNGWADGVHPADREYCFATYTAAFDKRASFEMEYRLRRADGEYRWLLDKGAPRWTPGGEFTGYVGSCIDITERRRAEGSLRERERWFRALIEHSADSISVLDPSNTILYLSPAVQAVEGYTPEELIGRNAAEYTHPDDRPYLREVLRELLAEPGRSMPIVWRRRHKDGHWIWLEGVVTNLLHDPAVQGLVTNYRDITARKQAEQQLLTSQEELRYLATHLQTVREEERMSVAREIHDELGQQLTGARLNLKWLEQNLAREPQLVHERLANTLELVSQTIQTVRRLSTSLHPAILDDFGLAAALEWQVKEFQKHSGIPCYLSTSQQEIELERNCALAVFRICQEALTNVARHAEAAEVRMSLAMEAENLWLRIQDNGRGISPDALTNTRSLGLISMRERALSFDGEFTIYGAPGEGTLIRVRIPLVRQAGNVTT